jgi:hypothetical protein
MRPSLAPALALIALAFALSASPGANGPKFFDDDPLWVDPEVEDASGIQPLPVSHQYDFIHNSFLAAGDRTNRTALNINTLGEVPDSSWFTNRVGRRAWSAAELQRGPDTADGPAPGTWTVIAAKSEGVTPGMTIRDGTGEVYYLKFDPPDYPEMASGAEIISTKILHAAGYHVPENYLAWLRPEAIAFAETAVIEDEYGRRRRMDERDLGALLERAARNPDGSYRVLASRRVPGTEVGRFRFHGTRPDDPNDIFPHEHRRDLRGLAVLAAWLNHHDAHGINTLDTLVDAGARRIVRHHLIDFGETLGSGSTQAQSPRAGNEYVWEARPTLITMLTLGFYVRPWVRVAYPDLPAVGRFESLYFRPDAWKPEYPNPAFLNARADDRFWGARLVQAFSEANVRAVVETARYTDRHATEYVIETLLGRRAKVLMAWLNGINPVVDPALSPSGTLTFGNAAVDAAVAAPAEYYTVSWSAFDNASGTHRLVGGDQRITSLRAAAPPELLAGRDPFVSARIRAFHPHRPAWSSPLDVYFRRTTEGWALVGLERHP